MVNSVVVASGIAFGKIVVSHALGLCDHLFSLSLPDARLLADLRLADASRRSSHRSNLRISCQRRAAASMDHRSSERGVALSKLTGSHVVISLDWNLMNSYPGLILPLIASASATFLFRQFFLTVPDELLDAARLDGASPMRFFWSILLPLSRANIVALAIILFLYGWNQYLWPLLITTDKSMATAIIGVKAPGATLRHGARLEYRHVRRASSNAATRRRHLVLQRWFVRGLVDSGK